MLYRVFGHTVVNVSTIVEAESEAEAIEVAQREFEGIDSYVGNGGDDKLIGVEGENETIAADDYVVFDDAQEEV